MYNGADWTQLCLATKRGHVGIVKLFLAYHADPNLKLGKRSTALQKTSSSERPDIVKLFLERDARSKVKVPVSDLPMRSGAAMHITSSNMDQSTRS